MLSVESIHPGFRPTANRTQEPQFGVGPTNKLSAKSTEVPGIADFEWPREMFADECHTR
jgi:hypothetical protein